MSILVLFLITVYSVNLANSKQKKLYNIRKLNSNYIIEIVNENYNDGVLLLFYIENQQPIPKVYVNGTQITNLRKDSSKYNNNIIVQLKVLVGMKFFLLN